MEQKNGVEPIAAHEARDRRLEKTIPRDWTPAEKRRATEGAPSPPASPNCAAPSGPSVVGYTSVSTRGAAGSRELRRQVEVITRECEQREFVLLTVVSEREATSSKGLGRPGLNYALAQIARREAQGLVVSELARLTHSAAELGTIIEWLAGLNARLVAAADLLDTGDQDGRLAADLLVEVSGWERERLSEQTRKGLQAARDRGRSTGRSAVSDDRELSERISRMRAQGMTLQAIADRLNIDGVPTVRGGAKWRHSSLQAAVGYRRGRRSGLQAPFDARTSR